MDVAKGVAERGKAVLGANLFRQRVVDLCGGAHHGVQILHDLPPRKPLGEVIDRQGVAQRRAVVHRLCLRRVHQVSFALFLHLAVKTEGGSEQKFVFQICLIVVGDFTDAALVKRAEFEQGKTPADAGGFRLRSHGQNHGMAKPVRRRVQGLHVPPVFVGTRKMIQQVF